MSKLSPEKQDWIRNKKSRKIILRQGQSPGDILTFTRALGDLKESFPDYKIDVRTPCPEIWYNNPRITPLKEDDPEVEIYTIGYDEINISGWNGLHFTDAFRHDLEKKLGVKIKKTGIRPEIWISDEEKSWFNQVHCDFGFDGPYWVINAGAKPDNELKQYNRYQEVVNILNDYFKDRVKFVQMGHGDHRHNALKGTFNMIGKTDTRQLIRLIHNAHGTIGPISFQMVLSAAFQQPAVCIAGGKEGVRWHIYPHMRWLSTNGCMDCCAWDGCWLGGVKGKCKHLLSNGVPKCFELIKPEEIARNVIMYYEGGLLKMPDKPNWLPGYPKEEKKLSIIDKIKLLT
jgi:ADP-heptose:LPS heptosyltransferase